MALTGPMKESRGGLIMSVNYTLNIVIALLITTVIIKILMNVIYHFGLDSVGFFEDLWRKIKKIK